VSKYMVQRAILGRLGFAEGGSDKRGQYCVKDEQICGKRYSLTAIVSRHGTVTISIKPFPDSNPDRPIIPVMTDRGRDDQKEFVEYLDQIADIEIERFRTLVPRARVEVETTNPTRIGVVGLSVSGGEPANVIYEGLVALVKGTY